MKSFNIQRWELENVRPLPERITWGGGGGGGISVFLIFLFHFVRLISSVQFQNPTRLIPSMESREYFIPCSCITKWEIVMRALDLSSRRQGGRRSMRPTALIKSRFQTPISPLNFHFNRVWKRWAHFPEYSIPCSCKKKKEKKWRNKKMITIHYWAAPTPAPICGQWINVAAKPNHFSAPLLVNKRDAKEWSVLNLRHVNYIDANQVQRLTKVFHQLLWSGGTKMPPKPPSPSPSPASLPSVGLPSLLAL